MQAHAHTHLLTCSKDWIKSHGWQSVVAALQRQAKPSCIKPEHRAPWAWPVKCYHTHLPGEKPGFITHIRRWLSGPVHPRPEQVNWFSFCHRCFIFFGKNCWSKMLLAHQQACHSLPVTSIRVSVDPGCLAMHLSSRAASFLPFHHSPHCEWAALLHLQEGRGQEPLSPTKQRRSSRCCWTRGPVKPHL